MNQPPNILLVLCDQLSALALRAWGNPHADTPHIDRIIDRGVRFENNFTICPLCQPARAAFWTGLYPHQTGILSNGGKHHVPPLPDDIPTLGDLFSQAGYHNIHLGKQHDAGALRGFTAPPAGEEDLPADPWWPINSDTKEDRCTQKQTVQFLNEYDGQAPFFAITDLNNPHNICGWVGAHSEGQIPEPPDENLPGLPDNLYINDFEKLPLPIQYVCCAHRRQAQIAEWSEHDIRLYLRAYHHYLSRVDAEIGCILEALNNRPDAGRTLIVLMADHGDSMGGHWLSTKHCTFYEETMRVPLVFSGPLVSSPGRAVSGLSSLIDLCPTLYDLAGLTPPGHLEGLSLAPWVRADRADSPHPFVTSQWHTEWGFTIEPGRMLRTDRYKYIRYLEHDGEEFYDLLEDPGETQTLIDSPDHRDQLEKHRALFATYLETTGDPFLSMEWKADPQWRAHKPGYRNHRGPAAPMVE